MKPIKFKVITEITQFIKVSGNPKDPNMQIDGNVHQDLSQSKPALAELAKISGPKTVINTFASINLAIAAQIIRKTSEVSGKSINELLKVLRTFIDESNGTAHA